MNEAFWMRRDKDLSERDRYWMQRLSCARVMRFGRIPDDAAEWSRQMGEVAAGIKAERAQRDAA